MSKDLLCATDDEDVLDALARMRAARVRRLPIVDDRRALVGLLAVDDVVEWLAEQLSEVTRLVRSVGRSERRRPGPGAAPPEG